MEDHREGDCLQDAPSLEVRGRAKEEGRRVGNPEAKAEPDSAGEACSAKQEENVV